MPLPLCACYDVTASAERAAFPPPETTGDFVYDLILRYLYQVLSRLLWLHSLSLTHLVSSSLT